MRVIGLLTMASLVLLALSRRAVAADEPPSFTKEIKPFLTHYCVDCHGPDRSKAGVKLDSYKSIMEVGRKKLVVPGKPDQSRLVLVLTGRGKQMPPRKYSAHPSTKEIVLVQAWITAGAKDDTVKAGLIMPEKMARPTAVSALQAPDLPAIEQASRTLWRREFAFSLPGSAW